MRFLLFLCYQYFPNIEWHVGIDTFFNCKDNENIRFFAGQSEYLRAPLLTLTKLQHRGM